jgi:tetratricopeptide (TPR) repeat protein
MWGGLLGEVISTALEAGVYLTMPGVSPGQPLSAGVDYALEKSGLASPLLKRPEESTLKVQDDTAALFPHMYELMTQIVEQTPDNVQAWFLRGVAAQNKGWHEEALMDFSEAIRLDPQHAKAYLLRSEVLASLGKYDMARADRQEALALDPHLV